MNGLKLDALVAPTAGPAFVIDQINGDRRLGSSSTPAALAGYPLLSMPVGYTPFGLPINLTFMGPAWSEPTLLKLAFALEQRLNARRPPRYLSTVELP
jgi:amidase